MTKFKINPSFAALMMVAQFARAAYKRKHVKEKTPRFSGSWGDMVLLEGAQFCTL